MGTFFQAYNQADFFGKCIFFSLFVLSCICWIFIIQKFLLFRQLSRHSKHFQKKVSECVEEILNLTTSADHPFGYLYHILKQKVVAILDKNHFFSSEQSKNSTQLSYADMESLTSHLEAGIVKQRQHIEKNLFILSTTVTLAPFLGLLGTVWGILVTFGELQAGQNASSNTVILGGLSTALTTTVLGLLIAIPALIAHSYLKNVSRHFTVDMYDFSHFLLSTVEIQYRKTDIQ